MGSASLHDMWTLSSANGVGVEKTSQTALPQHSGEAASRVGHVVLVLPASTAEPSGLSEYACYTNRRSPEAQGLLLLYMLRLPHAQLEDRARPFVKRTW